jgi:hypothetical protein
MSWNQSSFSNMAPFHELFLSFKGVILNKVKDLTAFRDSSPSAQNDITYSTDFGNTTLVTNVKFP